MLAVFGCSWACGQGVDSGLTFGSRLACKINSSEYINYGINGSSNSRSVLQLLNHIKLPNIKNSTAVFLITSDSRECIIDHKNIIHDFRSCNDIDFYRYKENNVSPPQLEFNLHRNILSMQKICETFSINDYYIVGWNDLNLMLPGIDANKIYPKSCVQLFGYSDQDAFLNSSPNQYCLKDRHPNEQGHELIAETLYDWIKNKIV